MFRVFGVFSVFGVFGARPAIPDCARAALDWALPTTLWFSFNRTPTGNRSHASRIICRAPTRRRACSRLLKCRHSLHEMARARGGGSDPLRSLTAPGSSNQACLNANCRSNDISSVTSSFQFLLLDDSEAVEAFPDKRKRQATQIDVGTEDLGSSGRDDVPTTEFALLPEWR